jgi:hypothetical protein
LLVDEERRSGDQEQDEQRFGHVGFPAAIVGQPARDFNPLVFLIGIEIIGESC